MWCDTNDIYGNELKEYIFNLIFCVSLLYAKWFTLLLLLLSLSFVYRYEEMFEKLFLTSVFIGASWKMLEEDKFSLY